MKIIQWFAADGKQRWAIIVAHRRAETTVATIIDP
jgi:hypothetical protein